MGGGSITHPHPHSKHPAVTSILVTQPAFKIGIQTHLLSSSGCGGRLQPVLHPHPGLIIAAAAAVAATTGEGCHLSGSLPLLFLLLLRLRDVHPHRLLLPRRRQHLPVPAVAKLLPTAAAAVAPTAAAVHAGAADALVKLPRGGGLGEDRGRDSRLPPLVHRHHPGGGLAGDWLQLGGGRGLRGRHGWLAEVQVTAGGGGGEGAWDEVVVGGGGGGDAGGGARARRAD